MALKYQRGFGNTFMTEAVRGALPDGQNSPQRPPRGLYPEVLSGTAFGKFGQGYLRLSYANSLPNIELALERLKTLFATRRR